MATLWEHVGKDYETAKARAPRGHEPFVLVYLAGRAAPIEAGVVDARRDGWVRIETAVRIDAETDAEPGPIPPNVCLVHAPQSAIIGVEIRFRPCPSSEEETPFGFRVTEK